MALSFDECLFFEGQDALFCLYRRLREEGLDPQLLAWLEAAYAFAANK